MHDCPRHHIRFNYLDKKTDDRQGQEKPDDQSARNGGLSHRLRRARLSRGLRLADLAGMVECSESYLSKVENGHTTPSLGMLHRIAAELGTSIAELFAESAPGDVVIRRFGDRPVMALAGGADSGGISLEQIAPFDASRLLEAHVHVVAPGAENGGVIRHEGEEAGYVLEGELELLIDGQIHHLKPGDTFFFPSERPHSYRNPGSTMLRIIWVSTPLTF